MKLSDKTWWKIYAALEDISIVETIPQGDEARVPSVLTAGWRSLLNLFSRELLYEQQIEFAERCLSVPLSPEGINANTLSKLKKLMLTVITT